LSEALHNVKRKSKSEVERVREEFQEMIREEADVKIREFIAEIQVLAEKKQEIRLTAAIGHQDN
jgi:NifU-like protein involved in Fe-S cluster formation